MIRMLFSPRLVGLSDYPMTNLPLLIAPRSPITGSGDWKRFRRNQQLKYDVSRSITKNQHLCAKGIISPHIQREILWSLLQFFCWDWQIAPVRTRELGNCGWGVELIIAQNYVSQWQQKSSWQQHSHYGRNLVISGGFKQQGLDQPTTLPWLAPGCFAKKACSFFSWKDAVSSVLGMVYGQKRDDMMALYINLGHTVRQLVQSWNKGNRSRIVSWCLLVNHQATYICQWWCAIL